MGYCGWVGDVDVGSAVGVGDVVELLDLALREHRFVSSGCFHFWEVEGFGEAEGLGGLLEGLCF